MLADFIQSVNQRRKKPLGHFVWINQPFLKICLVLRHDLILKTANLKHSNFPVIVTKDNLAKPGKQPR